MWAFIIAGIVFVLGLGYSVLELFGGGMSDNPSDNQAAPGKALRDLVITVVITTVIASTHYFPHLGW
jgi:hypothetical protein